MAHPALVESRPWLFTAIVASLAYYFLRSRPLGDTELLLLKGAGVASLAVYAWRRHPESDAKLLALVMALSAAGDMLIELSLEGGGAAFFASHLAAMTLYLRNRHAAPTSYRKLVAIGLLVAGPAVSWVLSGSAAVALYGLAVGGMAACAWMSRFPSARVGFGAALFVVSDWLIFAGMGPYAVPALSALLIWPLYFIGQFLIATGVVQTLRSELSRKV